MRERAGRVALQRCLPIVLHAGRTAPASASISLAAPSLARRLASGAACSTSGSVHSARCSSFAAGTSLLHSGGALAPSLQAADFAGSCGALPADRCADQARCVSKSSSTFWDVLAPGCRRSLAAGCKGSSLSSLACSKAWHTSVQSSSIAVKAVWLHQILEQTTPWQTTLFSDCAEAPAGEGGARWQQLRDPQVAVAAAAASA